jgi:hypothetical protein
MSTTGVPSSASRGSTRKRTDSAISNTRTRCSPMGFGRSGERVAKTPFRGLGIVSGVNLQDVPTPLIEPRQ